MRRANYTIFTIKMFKTILIAIQLLLNDKMKVKKRPKETEKKMSFILGKLIALEKKEYIICNIF